MHAFANLTDKPEVADRSVAAISFAVLSSPADLKAIENTWLRLCKHPESHPATFAAVNAVNADLIRPYIAVAKRGDEIVAMAIARLQTEPVPIRIGFKTFLAPRLRIIRLSYDGFIGDQSTAITAGLLDMLQVPLRANDADAMFFDHITAGSYIDQWTTTPPDCLHAERMQGKASLHWVTALHDKFETFLMALSKSERANLRANRSRIDRELGPRLRIACYRKSDDLETITTDTKRVAALTYQSALGASFAEQFWAESLFHSALESDIARCYIIYIDDMPSAFCHGLGWGDSFHLSFMGYDPAYADLGIGRLAIQHVIADLCAENKFKFLDFGAGHAEYKRRLGSANWTEVDRYVFASRFKPRLVNLLRGTISNLTRHADNLLQRVGVRERIKKAWKHHLKHRNSRREHSQQQTRID